ncbi:MAG TPA: hypothetical protein VNK24_04085 [Elusimicrobiota bacterium]|nr:hypothetical protein [Elusimicrobiota bacterium]HVC09505.1 hypothetical protein [Elusimicrobiota bacterium]
MIKGKTFRAAKTLPLWALLSLAAGGASCPRAQAQEIGPALDAAALISVPEVSVPELPTIQNVSEFWSAPLPAGAALDAAIPNLPVQASSRASAAIPRQALGVPAASAARPSIAFSAAPPAAVARRSSRRIAGPGRALEKAGRLKAAASSIFDGSLAAAAEAPAPEAFPASARAFYSGSLRLARKIPLKPSHISVMKDRVGLGNAAIFRFAGRARQVGKTCAIEALAACAEANGRKDPALLAKVMTAAKRAKTVLVEEPLAESEREKEELARQGRDTTAIEKKIMELTLRAILADDTFEHEGLSRKEQRRTAAEAGLDYRVLGRARGIADAVGPNASEELLEKFRQNSNSLKKKIDEELAQGNAVMVGVYTGIRKDGGSGFHALTVLGKGRKPSGGSYYIVYDSNLGHPMLYMTRQLFAIHAAVVR